MFYLMIKDGKVERKSKDGYCTEKEAKERKRELIKKSKKFIGKIKIVEE